MVGYYGFVGDDYYVLFCENWCCFPNSESLGGPFPPFREKEDCPCAGLIRMFGILGISVGGLLVGRFWWTRCTSWQLWCEFLLATPKRFMLHPVLHLVRGSLAMGRRLVGCVLRSGFVGGGWHER